MNAAFSRDRLTWIAYALIAWFAYLQAAPGLVVAHLREELELSYTVGGLHVAAFSAGSLVGGLLSSRLEQTLGRRRLLWSATALLGTGVVALTAGRTVGVTIGATLLMGLGGGVVLATVQATLADHHGAWRTVALAEANVAASVAYLTLIGLLALAAALGAGWRVALLVSLLVPVALWWRNRGVPLDAATASPSERGRLPVAFWIAAGVLVCTTAAEWCITAWGASFVESALEVSTDTAVTLMAGYFGGVLAGRVLGSRLARRHDPVSLLAIALGVAVVGFVVLWPTVGALQAVVGLALLGIGLGNLFPMAMSVAVARAPEQSASASGRAVAMASLAVLVAPLLVGTAADATSLKSALGVVPVLLVLAAAGLVVLRRNAAADRLTSQPPPGRS